MPRCASVFSRNCRVAQVSCNQNNRKYQNINIHKKARFIPHHPNLLYNYINVEIFHEEDEKEEDCIGWITVSSRAACDLATALEKNRISIDERKNIIIQLKNVLYYLKSVSLIYFDLKLQNILLIRNKQNGNFEMRLADFGIMCEARVANLLS